MRVLEAVGFGAGDEADFHPPTEHDPGGYREHVMVWRACELALAAVGRSWDDPVGLDWAMLDDSRRAEVSTAIDHALARLSAHTPWVAKDPRLCLTLPLWRRAVNPICVMTHRYPLDVARSLAVRDSMPVFGGLALWEFYQRAALKSSAGLSRVFVSFADLIATPGDVGAMLAERLRDVSAPNPWEPSSVGHDVIDGRLVRHRSGAWDQGAWLNPSQQRLFEAMEQAVIGAPGAGEALEVVAAEPVSEQALEVLTTLARHRRRQAEMAQRDHEISAWNEHLQRELAGQSDSA